MESSHADAKNFLDIPAVIGGWFICMYLIGRYCAYLWMPWFTYFSVIVRLFKVDQSKGKLPRDPTSIEKTEPKELLAQAKARI
jgi:hypothetical protein